MKNPCTFQLTESEEVWTVLKMCIELVNVSVELLPIRLFGHPDHESEQLPPSLARIDFIKSKLEFENFSDWSKTIDLVSQEVIFEDTRYQGELFYSLCNGACRLQVTANPKDLSVVGNFEAKCFENKKHLKTHMFDLAFWYCRLSLCLRYFTGNM